MYKDILLRRLDTFELLMKNASSSRDFKEETDYYIKLGKCFVEIRAICQVIREVKGVQLLEADDWSTMNTREFREKVRSWKE